MKVELGVFRFVRRKGKIIQRVFVHEEEVRFIRDCPSFLPMLSNMFDESESSMYRIYSPHAANTVAEEICRFVKAYPHPPAIGWRNLTYGLEVLEESWKEASGSGIALGFAVGQVKGKYSRFPSENYTICDKHGFGVVRICLEEIEMQRLANSNSAKPWGLDPARWAVMRKDRLAEDAAKKRERRKIDPTYRLSPSKGRKRKPTTSARKSPTQTSKPVRRTLL